MNRAAELAERQRKYDCLHHAMRAKSLGDALDHFQRELLKQSLAILSDPTGTHGYNSVDLEDSRYLAELDEFSIEVTGSASSQGIQTRPAMPLLPVIGVAQCGPVSLNIVPLCEVADESQGGSTFAVPATESGGGSGLVLPEAAAPHTGELIKGSLARVSRFEVPPESLDVWTCDRAEEANGLGSPTSVSAQESGPSAGVPLSPEKASMFDFEGMSPEDFASMVTDIEAESQRWG